MIKDAQGHALTGATADAVVHYDQAVHAFNLACGDAVGLFDAAREAAPDFVMAHLGRAWLIAFARDPSLTPHAAPLLETASTLAMNEREQAHLAALKLALAGALGGAVAILDRHVMRYPFDILAQEVALFFDQFLGRIRWMRDRTARALPLWSKDMPGYGALLTYHGFGLEETGDYARAEAESRAALELEPENSFAHHTVAHVMEMTGRPDDGLGWMLAREPFWTQEGHFLQGHIWWHKALFHLELGQYEAALALYDGPMRAVQRPVAAALTNASALLWRLDALGCDVADRWDDLATQWQGHADGRCAAFFDMHAAMAELGAGREELVEQRLVAMRATAASDHEAASTYREVGIPLVEGLTAFHRGRHEDAVALLLPVRFELWRIGGSHAQRDVVDWTLTEAALRGGLRDVALALANERLDARPRSAVNRRFLRRAKMLAA
jgi:tetratricopeptide (TPR) repeat protein